jgi:hypothetical protein
MRGVGDGYVCVCVVTTWHAVVHALAQLRVMHVRRSMHARPLALSPNAWNQSKLTLGRAWQSASTSLLGSTSHTTSSARATTITVVPCTGSRMTHYES